MNRIFTTCCLLMLFFVTSTNAQVLDIESTSEGIVIPRMTEAQKNAVASPVEGEMVYQTNGNKGFYYYDGSSWTAVAAASGGGSVSVLHAGASINAGGNIRYSGIGNSGRSEREDAEFAATRTGTLKNFHITFTVAVDNPASITVSVLVNGVSVFSHAMVEGDGRTYSDLVTSANVSQGDLIAVKFESGADDPTTDDPNFIYMTCAFELH